jgi:hypothetical protein
VDGGQAFEVLLSCWRESVVNFISWSPELEFLNKSSSSYAPSTKKVGQDQD